ncbi:MAG: hypothetical protein MUQ65_12125, partial [Armatimonadetes bacterium]|nr:hypothetical protein [Armatimonadota bacterium]
MTQYARPTSDITVNSWTTTPLFEQIDETTYFDADYIQRNAVADCEVGLSSVTDPLSSADHYVRYRLGRSATNRTLTMFVRLYQGSTEIASWEHVNPDLSFVGFEQTLSGAQADAITNYADLRLRFDITAIQNNQTDGQVSWAELAVPDAVDSDDLTAEDITAGTPTLDEPTLVRISHFDPTDITAAAPLLDQPTLVRISHFDPTDITAAAPLLDQPTL